MKSNQHLERDVLEALTWEPLLYAAEIGVIARDGVITLTGHVNSYPKKLAAERAAKSVRGVRAVAEEIEVKIAHDHRRTDTEIATAAVNALHWCNSVPDGRITVSVENGWVKLEGDVEWKYQKDEARREIEDLNGVTGVSNFIMVNPELNPAELKGNIQRALQRSATVEASHISVDVNGSLVTLKGTVRSWAEREDAENAAWSAPGVAKVEDQILVEAEVH